MKIGFVRVFVTDMQKSLDYYSNTLGMEVDVTDGTNWAQFKSGEDISLAIEKCAPDHTEFGSRMVGRFSAVTFMVDDIAQYYELALSRGVEFTMAPVKQAWGGTLAHLRDPDGNILTVMQEA